MTEWKKYVNVLLSHEFELANKTKPDPNKPGIYSTDEFFDKIDIVVSPADKWDSPFELRSMQVFHSPEDLNGFLECVRAMNS